MAYQYQRGKLLYEGKASNLYRVADERGKDVPDMLIIERKDDITAGDGEKRDSIKDKGLYTNKISNILFRQLEEEEIPTHFVQELSAHETLIMRTTPLKLEVVVRNIATGSLCKGLPIPEGQLLDQPIIDLCYKSDEHHDPLVNHGRILALGVVDYECDLEEIEELASEINEVLKDVFSGIGITLVDFKIEFGRTESGEIILIDEISPDTCRFWDAKTGKKLDKDNFRNGEGNDVTASAYSEIFRRLAAKYAPMQD